MGGGGREEEGDRGFVHSKYGRTFIQGGGVDEE